MTDTPSTIGRHQVTNRLGRRGTTYRAWDPEACRFVAITLAPPGADHQRFVAAATAALGFEHPHVASVLGIGDLDGRPYVATEFVFGRTFADLVRTRAPMAPDQILFQGADLCDALAVAHGRQLVHRAFEPEHAIVDRDGTVKFIGSGIDDPVSGRDAEPAPLEEHHLALAVGRAIYDLLAVPAPQPVFTAGERRTPLSIVNQSLDATVAAFVDDWVSGLHAPLSLTAVAADLRAAGGWLLDLRQQQPPVDVPADAAGGTPAAPEPVPLDDAIADERVIAAAPAHEPPDTPPDPTDPATDTEWHGTEMRHDALGLEAFRREAVRTPPADETDVAEPPAPPAHDPAVGTQPAAVSSAALATASPVVVLPVAVPRGARRVRRRSGATRRRAALLAAGGVLLVAGSLWGAVAWRRTAAGKPLPPTAAAAPPAASPAPRAVAPEMRSAPAATMNAGDAPVVASVAASAARGPAVPPPSSRATQASRPVRAAAPEPAAKMTAAARSAAADTVRDGAVRPRSAAPAQEAPPPTARSAAAVTLPPAAAVTPVQPAGPQVVSPSVAAPLPERNTTAATLTLAPTDEAADCLDPSAVARILICEAAPAGSHSAGGGAAEAAPTSVEGPAAATAGAVGTTGTTGSVATAASLPAALATPDSTHDAALVTFVQPLYPEAARRAGITGGVHVDITIDGTGRVVRASAISGPMILREAAESALRQWRFTPASLNGAPVASRRRFLLTFSAVSPPSLP